VVFQYECVDSLGLQQIRVIAELPDEMEVVLGLVEMTRKRTRESLGRILSERCFYCEGRGFLKNRSTVCQEILREIQRDIRDLRGENILVDVHPNVANFLYDGARGDVERLERRFHKRIIVSTTKKEICQRDTILFCAHNRSQLTAQSKCKFFMKRLIEKKKRVNIKNSAKI
jgi:hypothetical protein